MTLSSSDIAGNNKSSDRDVGIILAVLESGNSVELPATGYSMFPTLRPGDKVLVTPLDRGDLPKPGTVVIFSENDGLVMHRLIEIQKNDTGDLLIITKGDSIKEYDKPFPQKQLIGVAASFKRGKKEHSLKVFIPRYFRLLSNRKLLWLYLKLKRVLNFLF